MKSKNHEEIEEFKKILLSVMHTIGKECTEKEFRKAYHAIRHENVNVMVDKLGVSNFPHFLRYKCRDIFEVYLGENIGDIKILRLECAAPVAQPKPDKKKVKKNSSAPKLNFPRVGIINSTTFPRRNPQGFGAKKFPSQPNQPLSSKPFYQSHLNRHSWNVYRSAEQLNLTEKLDDEEIDEENCMTKRRIFASQEQLSRSSKPEAPALMSLSDFPTLAMKDNEEVQPYSTSILLRNQERFFREEDSNSNSSEGTVIAEPENQVSNCFKSNSRISQAFASIDALNESFSEEFNFDDPIFRMDCPGKVVEDPTIVIPKPKLVPLEETIPVEVRFIEVYSPNQFWFQYNEALLTLLTHDMEDFYSTLTERCLVMSADRVRRDLIVAAKTFETWHRAQVVSEPDKNGDVLLFFVDFGTHQAVNIADIRYLVDIFVDIPAQALRGSLLGIAPTDDYGEWDSTARQAFYEKVKNKTHLGSIRFHRQDDDVYEMEIFDQTKGNTIADDLILEGLAETEEIDADLRFLYPLPIADYSCASIYDFVE